MALSLIAALWQEIALIVFVVGTCAFLVWSANYMFEVLK
jgi:hypothetical protein